jgi:hypothetical protein
VVHRQIPVGGRGPFGACKVSVWRERRLVDVIAADHGTAARSILYHRLRTVDMAGEHVVFCATGSTNDPKPGKNGNGERPLFPKSRLPVFSLLFAFKEIT